MAQDPSSSEPTDGTLTLTNVDIQNILNSEDTTELFGIDVEVDRNTVASIASLDDQKLMQLYNERIEDFRRLHKKARALKDEAIDLKRTIDSRKEHHAAAEAAAQANRTQIEAEIAALSEQLRALRGEAPLLRTVENAIALSLVRHDADPSWVKQSQYLATIRSQVLKDDGQVAKEKGEAIRQRRDWYLQITGVILAFTVLLIGVGLTAAFNSTVGGVAIGIGLIQAALSYGRLFFGMRD